MKATFAALRLAFMVCPNSDIDCFPGPNRLCYCAALACLLGCGGVVFAAEPPRPNIVLIVADDLGWSDVGWHGGPARTPHLDRLAAQGVVFDRGYVATSLCRASLMSLITGRHGCRRGAIVSRLSQASMLCQHSARRAKSFHRQGCLV